jgi:predicted CxxxxCH...CXXCH cytochrome family protein
MCVHYRSISSRLIRAASVFVLIILTSGSCSKINNLPDISADNSSCDAEACHPSTALNREIPTSGMHTSHLNSSSDIACTDCHYNYLDNPLHKNGFVNGYDIRTDIDTEGDIISFNPAKNAAGVFDTSTSSCSNMDCHLALNWYSTMQLSCGICHSEGSSNNPVSGSHSAHINAGQTCEHCHAGYKESSAHNDGNNDTGIAVSFNTINSSGIYSAGECSNLVCHGSSLYPATQGTDITPEWGNAATGKDESHNPKSGWYNGTTFQGQMIYEQ